MLNEVNYYDLLGVNTGSTAQDIKRAYFAAIRKYPPERFPEEFKRIRQAYDTLSDAERRKSYDSKQKDSESGEYCEKAEEAYGKGNYREAADYLRKSLEISPNDSFARNLLGLCLAETGELEKAADVFRKLTRDFPDSAVFYCNLGSVLFQKGAEKQAVDALKTAIEIDETDFNAWDGLGLFYYKREEYAMAREALLKGIQICGETTSSYMKLINIDVAEENIENLKEDVGRLEKLAEKDNELKDNVSWSLVEIAKNIMGAMPEFAAKLLEKAKKLNPEEKEIKSLHRDAAKMRKLEEPFARLSADNAIHPWLKEILSGAVFGYDSEYYEADADIRERFILRSPQNVVSSAVRVKDAYPEIFNEYKKFLQTIIDNPAGIQIDEKKLLDDIRHMDMAMGNSTEDISLFSLDDIYVPPMQQVKTFTAGRNDPCPCGSGKKYKKCCLNK